MMGTQRRPPKKRTQEKYVSKNPSATQERSTKKALSILLISEFSVDDWKGGGEKRYYELARQFIAKGHTVTWLCMRTPQHQSPYILDGIRIIPCGPQISNPPHRSILDFIRYATAIVHHLWHSSYDVIDCQTYMPLLGAYPIAKIRRLNLVATIHDVSTASADQWVQHSAVASLVERFIDTLNYNKVVTVSKSVRKLLIAPPYNVPEDRITAIHNGVNLQDIDAIPPQKKTKDIIYVGRLIEHKHVEDIIAIVEELQCTCMIVGEGPQEKHLKDLVRQRKLGKFITFTGRLAKYDDVIVRIKQAKVLVLPSTREGFGLVLADANACGVPVAAYRVPGVIDVVEHDKNGILVRPRDVSSLAKGVEEILGSEKLQKKMGQYGRRKVEENFTWDLAADRLLACYRAGMQRGDEDNTR